MHLVVRGQLSPNSNANPSGMVLVATVVRSVGTRSADATSLTQLQGKAAFEDPGGFATTQARKEALEGDALLKSLAPMSGARAPFYLPSRPS